MTPRPRPAHPDTPLITITPPQPPGHIAVAVRAVRQATAQVRRGRPGILALRILGAAGLTVITLHSGAGPGPITGTLTGAGTWFVLTARRDLAPPPGR